MACVEGRLPQDTFSIRVALLIHQVFSNNLNASIVVHLCVRQVQPSGAKSIKHDRRSVAYPKDREQTLTFRTELWTNAKSTISFNFSCCRDTPNYRLVHALRCRAPQTVNGWAVRSRAPESLCSCILAEQNRIPVGIRFCHFAIQYSWALRHAVLALVEMLCTIG
jgi:hypothetical protein